MTEYVNLRMSAPVMTRTIQVADGNAVAKRALDISIATIAIVALIPVLVILTLAVWLHDGRSPLFVQERIGRGGKPFKCLKFRTMVVDANQRLLDHFERHPEALVEWAADHKLRNDPRITPIGRFLRSSSLDELPQLLNVLSGSMSMVGPRPIVSGEIVRYGRYFKNYCEVRPGITGLWQVSGRNDVSYRRRVVLDLVYSRTQSVPFDMMILSRTIPAVLGRKGSY